MHNHANPNPSPALSYLLGAYLGDGSIRRESRHDGKNFIWRMRFDLKDYDFAVAVQDVLAILLERKRPYSITKNRRGYFVIEACSKDLCEILLDTEMQKAIAGLFPSDFLRGMFDAEGTVTERLAIYNTDPWKVDLCVGALSSLGIRYRVNSWEDKRVGTRRLRCYAIRINRAEDREHFRQLVGSSVMRKMLMMGG